MGAIVEKVTAFVTRQSAAGRELLLFQHPSAGIQIPAGTVEAGETPEEAVLREAAEETGLSGLILCRSLGCEKRELPEDQRMIARWTKVYARPDWTSFDWAHFPAGTTVQVLRKSRDFTQVSHIEPDRFPLPQYTTMSITGWVPDAFLASTVRRHFFHLDYRGTTSDNWTVATDNHTFTLFWASFDGLPEIVSPQSRWLEDFWVEPPREAA